MQCTKYCNQQSFWPRNWASKNCFILLFLWTWGNLEFWINPEARARARNLICFTGIQQIPPVLNFWSEVPVPIYLVWAYWYVRLKALGNLFSFLYCFSSLTISKLMDGYCAATSSYRLSKRCNTVLAGSHRDSPHTLYTLCYLLMSQPSPVIVL